MLKCMPLLMTPQRAHSLILCVAFGMSAISALAFMWVCWARDAPLVLRLIGTLLFALNGERCWYHLRRLIQ